MKPKDAPQRCAIVGEGYVSERVKYFKRYAVDKLKLRREVTQ